MREARGRIETEELGSFELSGFSGEGSGTVL